MSRHTNNGYKGAVIDSWFVARIVNLKVAGSNLFLERKLFRDSVPILPHRKLTDPTKSGGPAREDQPWWNTDQ